MSGSRGRSRGRPSQAGEQLSLASCLDPHEASQGSLFAALDPPAAPGIAAAEGVPLMGDDGAISLDADALAAAARARPRPRRGPAMPAAAEAVEASTAADPASAASLAEPVAGDEVGGSGAAGAEVPGAVAAGSMASPGCPEPESGADGEDLPRWHHHSLVDPEALPPVLRHYVALKAAHPERVLLYRLGDFFEFFFEDAILLSRLLELTLTGKEAGRGIGRVPMAGIPYHAAERHCAELVRQGLSVALCDQLESTPAKGALLRREITRVLTPGTVLEEGMLAARRNNWLCAVVLAGGAGRGPRRWGLAVADISTGEFRVTEREGEQALHQELLQLEAAEVIGPFSQEHGGGAEALAPNDTVRGDTVRSNTVRQAPVRDPSGSDDPCAGSTLAGSPACADAVGADGPIPPPDALAPGGADAVADPERPGERSDGGDGAGAAGRPERAGFSSPAWCPDGRRLTSLPRTPFEAPEARARLLRHYRLASLDGLGLGELPLALRAAGGLLAYLESTQPAPLELPTVWYAGDQLVLDAQTRRNLELTRTQLGGSQHGSLLWALDRTCTAMGGRGLRRWLEAPLVECQVILRRQQAVSELVAHRPLRLAVRRLLRPMGDLERLAGRAGAGTASPRDLVALADGLERLPRLASLLQEATSAPLAALSRPWPDLVELARDIRHHLVEAPPLTLAEGGLIHDGVDAQLDGLRNLLDDQDNWLARQEAEERRASGNPNLRLQYHRTFGYFLAVSRARATSVPEHWIRRQTLANEERFVTPALKDREGRILQLRTRSVTREQELFTALRSRVGTGAAAVREAARLVAELDALASLAEVAATGGYCCPELGDGRELLIEAGRHPVVEQLLVEEAFTANDLQLGGGGGASPDLLVLTGPNASGKSCYLRQTGLLQLMAQIGSWIPARSARLGLADRIFTRVGAGDDLAAGQSTFLVEMAETANILHHATPRSLVLLDEIGRGTATFDGLSIAWAVAEHLATPPSQGGLGARTIFATHYHELNELAELLPTVGNAQVLVEETGDDLVFLHRVRRGGASRSYGIEAARLAGVPASVVLRARQVLGRIEANSHIAVGMAEAAAPPALSTPPSTDTSTPSPTATSTRRRRGAQTGQAA